MAIYLKCVSQKAGNIQGGVTAQGFQNWIEVTSLEFGYRRPMELNHPTGRAVVSDIRVTKHVDKASVLLSQLGMMNDASTLNVCYVKEGAGHKAYLKIDVSNALVSQYDHLASHDGSTVEKVSFSFTKMDYTWMDGGIMGTIDLMLPA